MVRQEVAGGFKSKNQRLEDLLDRIRENQLHGEFAAGSSNDDAFSREQWDPPMSFADYRLETAESKLGLTIQLTALFEERQREEIPDWLEESLARGREAGALVSEKSRSEFIVVPILLAARRFSQGPLSIFSGQRLDVDPQLGLVGECDFILARTPPLPRLKSPIVTILEAKKNDIELGLGQCVAQLVAARMFNEQEGLKPQPLYGCVTSGQVWQFLRLDEMVVSVDPKPLYLNDLGAILATFRSILEDKPSV